MTVDCSCLISSLYPSFSSCSFLSLSLVILCVSKSCCMISPIVISRGMSLFLPLGVGLLSVWWLASLPSFSALLVTILVAMGEVFFRGVASADAESESLVNRLSRLGGLPSAPPCLPSLFLFSACSLSLIIWSSASCPSTSPCASPSGVPPLAIPPPRAPPRPLGAGISTPHRGASLEIRGNHQETLLQLVVQ